MDKLSASAIRLRTMLRTAMGEGLGEALINPNVFEIMVNPDGSVRLDLAGEGRVDTGILMSGTDIERIIRLVASHSHRSGPQLARLRLWRLCDCRGPIRWHGLAGLPGARHPLCR